MELITYLGLIAAIFTSTSMLPQVVKALKLKETKDISLPAFLLMETGLILWLIYGIMISNIPIIFANVVSVIFVSGVLLLKLKYG